MGRYNDYGSFIRTAVRLAREQNAMEQGWSLVRDNRQQIPPQMKEAVTAIRRFYDQMLDLGDQACLLPGKRTLEARRAEYEDAFDELQSAYAEMDAAEAQYPLTFTEPPVRIAQRILDEAADWHDPITNKKMWDRLIGPDRTIETPIGPVKIGANQFEKLQARDRADFSGLVLPTLTKPSIVLRETDGAVKFIRAFRRGKETIFLSISRDIEDAGQVVISNYPIRRSQLEKAIESGAPLYSTALDASAEAPPQQAARSAGGRPDGSTIIDKPAAEVQTLYTSVPRELIGVELFDWGAKGLRLGTKQPVRGVTGRPRRTWDSGWNHDLQSIPVGRDPELIRALFHQGTVSRNAALNPDYRGIVPAEVLKDSYQVMLYDTLTARRATSVAVTPMVARQKDSDTGSRACALNHHNPAGRVVFSFNMLN